jgi:hypothetical protein
MYTAPKTATTIFSFWPSLKVFCLPDTQLAAKNKDHRNQGSIDKKINFFPVPKSHTQMGSLSVKNVRKKSHAWAPLNKAFSTTTPSLVLFIKWF